jgi:hypothetical protein
MTTTNEETLARLVAGNCRQLFTDYQLKIRSAEPLDSHAEEHFLLCGVIGFTSKHLRGALVLACTREPLERTNPGINPSHRDWICELANQLLGRVKNQMLDRNVEIYQSTPVALRGDHLAPVFQQRLVAELFTAEGGVICVWMDCEFDEGFAIPEASVCDAAPLSEGEMSLF